MPATSTVRLPREVTGSLIGLARACGTAEEAVALAGVALLLRRYTGVAVRTLDWRSGSGNAGIKVDLTDDVPVRDLVIRIGAGLGGGPAAPATTADGGGAEGDGEPFAGTVPVELALDETGWVIKIDGCPADLVEFVAADLAALLDRVGAGTARSTLDALPESAYERTVPADLADLHARPGEPRPAPAFGAGDTICTAFATQVARHPDRAAVLADDGCLTYRELGSAVSATARAIRSATGGAKAGRVALLCRHGATTITGLLAVLVSGRAYVPLDPTFPPRRLADILADSGADALLTDTEHADLAERLITDAGVGRLPVVAIASGGDAAAEDVPAGLASPATPDDPAYVLYTSGSTGVPKGVVQSHRNVLFGVANHVRNFAITPKDRTSVLTSFGYDMAVTDTFSAILSGAAAVPADIRTHGLGHLARTLSHHGVTIYHSTPTVYRYLLASLGEEGRLPLIRAVLLGGEEVTRHDVDLARRHFSPDTIFVNGYGTTEISFAAQNHVPPGAPLAHAVVPIGRPLPGVDVVLADPAGRATCLSGEIVVRCRHVALGYWGLPELTASRFVEFRGERAYRTGDLARRLPDGTLVYLGRADRMVKIRGYRVELGEIESRLAGLPGVAHAAVVAGVRADGEKEIIGYAVPGRGATLTPDKIRGDLGAVLPDFMLPRAVVIVDELPIGPTGKLDLRALPPPPRAGVAAGEPGDPLARTIASAWCAVLGVEGVDHHTSFFQVGGHSLLLALVQQRLERELGHRLPLTVLFEHATVAGLAEYLRTGAGSGPDPVDRAADRMRRRRMARQGSAETVEKA